MKVIGVDPGLNTTGYGVIEFHNKQVFLLDAGVIRGGGAELPLEERLQNIYQGMMEVLAEHHPDALAVEQLYSHRGYRMTSVLMGHARGVICLAAARNGVPVYSYSATQIKNSLTGVGRASKEQMQRMIQHRLGLHTVPVPHDMADALAVALCHCSIMTGPVLAKL